MLRIFEYNKISAAERRQLLIRQSASDTSAHASVADMLRHIAQEGAAAALSYSQKFDGVQQARLSIDAAEWEAAPTKLKPELKQAFEQAAANITTFHNLQKEQLQTRESEICGTRVGFCYQPFQSAGIYVPGGLASYPSSVLMGAIPARIAGVPELTLITPPKADGSIDAAVLYCAQLAGVQQVLPMGGAQGIAAAAYGLASNKASEIIVGPGNRYVTTAKSLLAGQGQIRMDLPAGPSEVLVIADASARAEFVAADLLSQAEHGADSVAALLCCSHDFAAAVSAHIANGLSERPQRRELKTQSIREHSFALVFTDWDELYEFANDFGAEHLELCVDDALKVFQRVFLQDKKITNVGSVFLGHYAPVALGDYFSGTNHVLPTGGAARFYAGLSVDTFLKRISYQYPSAKSLKQALEPILLMSRHEGLAAEHGHSVAVRFAK